MADKPSNSRKRVEYRPARNGAAARWRIEERGRAQKPEGAEEASAQSTSARDENDRRETSTRERARARVAERQKSRRKESSASPSAPKKVSSPGSSSDKAGSSDRSGRGDATARGERAGRSERSRRSESASRNDRARHSKQADRAQSEKNPRSRRYTSERTRDQVMEAMMPAAERRGAPLGLSRNALAIFGALLVIVVVFFVWHPWSSGTNVSIPEAPESSATSDVLEERLAALPKYGSVAPVDFNAIEEDGYTTGFVLAPGGVVTDYSIYETEPELSDESAQALNDALEPFLENDVIVGFLLMDIETGRGFARNLDMTLYGASSFKGPYCAYLLKQYVDHGSIALTDAFASGYMTESLGYARDGSETLERLVEETIVDSSNDAFASLRVSFSDATLSEWLTSVDVDGRIAYDTWFPFNTVRNMAKLWMETYYFLGSGTEAATSLLEYMGQTSKSFIREALTGVRVIDENELVENVSGADADDDGAALAASTTLGATGTLGRNLGNAIDHSIEALMAPEITVVDKAGWNIDSDPNYDALVDCGIVTCNGRDYLLCVMCDAGYTDYNVDKFEQLIAAIFNTRSDLA